MFEKLEILRMTHAMASHAAARQSVIARNVANADTPGYRARETEDFATYFARLRSETPWGASGLPQPELGRIAGNSALSPNGNSVSLEQEMMRAVEVRHQHDLALTIQRSASGILRSSLGR